MRLANRLVAALPLAIIIVAGAWAQEPPKISQLDERFHPNAVTLKRGQTLVVRNDDPFIHHVYVDDEKFKYDSGEQRPGRALSITFTEPGEFLLECAIHLKMRLRVTVTAD